MQDDQQQKNSENNETSSDPLERNQRNVTAIEDSNDSVEKKDATFESKPEMCGWALLQMAEEKKLQQQKESRESSEEEGIKQ